MSGFRSALEEKVVADVRERRDEIVALVSELVACDTTARRPDDPPRDEEKLQGILAARVRALGAEPELWEPEPIPQGNRHFPGDLDFRGRPQLAATLRGSGVGRSLLLNGHIDVVDVEPRAQWTSDPFTATLRDGKLYGRGVNDMKGGVAGLVVALESLQRCGVRLCGDVVFCTVTDEESSGAGGWSAVEHGVRADAGFAAEGTGLHCEVACRGTLTPAVTVPGRAGHAEMAQPHWREGGAVNAIEKTMLVLDAVRALREDWRTRADQQHPLLSPGDVVPVIVKGGTWEVTYPASCTLTLEAMYLPGKVDAEGTGRAVEREIEERINAAVAADPWLAEHPLVWRWHEDIVPADIPGDHPLVEICRAAAGSLGWESRVTGLDSWHDAATFTAHGTPTFSIGPDGGETCHAVDERSTVDSLVDFAALTTLAAMRWCGTSR